MWRMTKVTEMRKVEDLSVSKYFSKMCWLGAYGERWKANCRED